MRKILVPHFSHFPFLRYSRLHDAEHNLDLDILLFRYSLQSILTLPEISIFPPIWLKLTRFFFWIKKKFRIQNYLQIQNFFRVKIFIIDPMGYKNSKNVRGSPFIFWKKIKKFFIAYSVLKHFKTLKSTLVLKIMFSTSLWHTCAIILRYMYFLKLKEKN